MEKSVGIKLLESVAASEPIASKLGAIRETRWPVQFSHVVEPAQAFLTAVIAHACHGRPPDDRGAADSTIWVLCPSVHSQELLYESLLNWLPEALFLPEAELVAVENVLPDPEIAAERLALLMEIDRDTGPRIIVATRASLDQPATKRGALQSAVSQLRRGANAKMEQLLDQLIASGYERVAQVTTRGQFAVRGGIVDLYSWHAPLPYRLEFFGDQIESLREFDIDSQTSVRDLASVDILLNDGATQGQIGEVRDYLREGDVIIDIEPAKESSDLGSAGASPALARASRASGTVFGEAPKTAGGAPALPTRGSIILWDDTFVRYHEPHIGFAAVKVLEALGFEVALAKNRRCCGRPAFSQGNLDLAAKLGKHNVDCLSSLQHSPGRRSLGEGGSTPILFLEPSCWSMFVEDYRELNINGAEDLAKRCFTFEKFVDDLLARQPNALQFNQRPATIAIHPHCHAKSIMNPEFMRRLAERLPGRKATVLDTACCGMAGAFGALAEKYDLSVQVAQRLLDNIDNQPPGTEIIASGTSCRHQITDLSNARPKHMAELIAEAIVLPS